MCWLIEDQSQVPLHLRVRCQADADSIAELHCRWGEADPDSGGLVRGGYSGKEAAQLAFKPDSIPWLYHVDIRPTSPPEAHSAGLCTACQSLYLRAPLGQADLCSECAHVTRGEPPCDHQFGLDRCLRCYWDGSHPLDREPP